MMFSNDLCIRKPVNDVSTLFPFAFQTMEIVLSHIAFVQLRGIYIADSLYSTFSTEVDNLHFYGKHICENKWDLNDSL